eukprot:CAMPEP_0198579844 /NCGR_PEP_ID=MMETSP1462-20131121/122082_1 /TAXON_ID=1333877 /ORGANISM="Brandtodinium nutriculum, Strain RCC3387" /LENGTH=271 /DNA_ID=CAMNT_0044311179 /DNA_START=18 /DNA_END=830 /DNA_ORIENTATION=-
MEAGDFDACDDKEPLVESSALVPQGDVDVPIVAPGSMRLQGSFEGTATTSTHQLELAVGLDLEMPSQIAAEAMRQMAARSRSASPLGDRRLLASSGLPPDSIAERPSIFSSLASFFRRDAKQAQQDSQGKLALPGLSIKLDENPEVAKLEESCSQLEDERGRLAFELSMYQSQVVELQDQVDALTCERDEVVGKLDEVQRNMDTTNLHVEGLRRQADVSLNSSADLGAQLRAKECEVRELQERLDDAIQQARASGLRLDSQQAAAAEAAQR